MVEFQLGKLAKKRLAHSLFQVFRMDFFSPGQEVEKGAASLDPPLSDQAAEGKESHSFRGIFLERRRNMDLPFGI
jgi:hypothetical protein